MAKSTYVALGALALIGLYAASSDAAPSGAGACATFDEDLPPEVRANLRKLLDADLTPGAYAAAAAALDRSGFPLAAACFRKRSGGAALPRGFNADDPATWGPLRDVIPPELIGGGFDPLDWSTWEQGPQGPMPVPGPVVRPPGDVIPGYPPGVDPADPATWSNAPGAWQIRPGETPQYLAEWYTGEPDRWVELGVLNPQLGAQNGGTYAGWAPGLTIALPGDWSPLTTDPPPAPRVVARTANVQVDSLTAA